MTGELQELGEELNRICCRLSYLRQKRAIINSIYRGDVNRIRGFISLYGKEALIEIPEDPFYRACWLHDYEGFLEYKSLIRELEDEEDRLTNEYEPLLERIRTLKAT